VFAESPPQLDRADGHDGSSSVWDLFRRPAWYADAACRGLDVDMFFAERGELTAPAKAVCRGCPVRSECRESALANGEKFGIWGGLSERERRKVRTQRRTSAPRVEGVAPAPPERRPQVWKTPEGRALLDERRLLIGCLSEAGYSYSQIAQVGGLTAALVGNDLRVLRRLLAS
jgi:WhiB family redox-sensing transcriptional regulator